MSNINIELNSTQVTIITKALEQFTNTLNMNSNKLNNNDKKQVLEIMEEIKDILLKF